LIGYYAEGGLITKQAREMGLNQPIVGGDGI
jgi:branched-chain amino acid transport system substrate-binding protein